VPTRSPVSLLVRTPPPKASESLLGYALRVSEANGYDTPWHVFRLAGVGPDEMQSPKLQVGKLAKVLGLRSSALEPMGYSCEEGGESSYRLLGQSLGKGASEGYLRLRKPAICTQCVEGKGHIDAFWDLSAAVACPDHQCKVLEKCPECSMPLSWFRPGLLQCRCGANLASAAAEPIDAALAEFMGFLRAKLQGVSLATKANTSGFPVEHLEGLALLTLMQLAKNLGQHELLNRGVDADGASSAVEASVEVLRDWPAGYHQFLARTGERLAQRGVVGGGLRRQFEPFYESMFKGRTWSKHTEFLRSEFVNFGLRQWGRAVLDNKLLRGQQPTERRFITKSEFARRYGLSKPTLERLISEGSVRVEVAATEHSSRTAVDLASTTPPTEKAGLVTVREAAAQVGLPVSVLRHLREVGVFSKSPRVGHGTSWFRDDVQAFLEAGRGLPQQTLEGPVVSLESVMRRKLRDAAAKGGVVAAVFDGRLVCAGLQGQNLSGLMLDKKQVEDIVRLKRREVEGTTYSVADAAVETGLDRAVMDHAIELGYLQASAEEGRSVRVLASSVERFNERFVSLVRLAKERGTLARNLLSRCRERGLPVVELRRSGRVSSQPILTRSNAAELVKDWDQARLVESRRKFEARRLSQLESLRGYLDSLRERAEPLPRRAGNPNKAVIARACGFGRDVFSSATPAMALLAEYELLDSKMPDSA